MDPESPTDDLTAQIIAAGARARIETLEAGVPVFYWDSDRKFELMEMPDGRKFEIRYIPGAPRNRNYEIIREVHPSGECRR